MAVRGWVQACEWQRRGSELDADAALDALSITVEDPTDFDDAGGVLSINDQTIAYSEIDDDTGVIQLETGLAAAATIGDPVYTVAGGDILQDVVLFVDCGDGDLVEVRVPFAQRDYWPEGDYEDPVEVELSDDLEKVIDAPGRIPTSTELAEARGGFDGTLQDIYDAANAAAAAAADAAANATTAMTAANGKNKLWVSLSDPGSTPNTAGDIWWKKDSSSQTIIGQWNGLGGTSWQVAQVANAAIANLDAGKLVAGSAFTNALSVKTNFTLGDAATNGVIQSYNFASSPVGVFIDKNGIVAKGGSIAGASITGSTITGGTFQTATSGQRVVIDSTNVARYYDSGGVQRGTIAGLPTGMKLTGAGSASVQIATTGVGIAGHTSMDSFDTVDDSTVGGNLDVIGTLNVIDTTISGKFIGNNIRNNLTAAPNARWVNTASGGELGFTDNSSSRTKKKQIRPLADDVDVAKAYELEPVSFLYKKKPGDRPADFRLWGYILEQIQDLGLDFLWYEDEVDYVKVGVLQQLAIRDLNTRLAEVERQRAEDRIQIDRQAELIAKLAERIEQLDPR